MQSSIQWVFYFLCKNPDLHLKDKKAILEIFTRLVSDALSKIMDYELFCLGMYIHLMKVYHKDTMFTLVLLDYLHSIFKLVLKEYSSKAGSFTLSKTTEHLYQVKMDVKTFDLYRAFFNGLKNVGFRLTYATWERLNEIRLTADRYARKVELNESEPQSLAVFEILTRQLHKCEFEDA
jgi:hypothetical protein